MGESSALFAAPPAEIRQSFLEVPTPSIVYDLDGIDRTVQILRKDMSIVRGAQLNFALKATHTIGLLRYFAKLGLGADVASKGEYELARLAKFAMVTATGPSFDSSDFALLGSEGTLIDASSEDQLIQFLKTGNIDVGLRIRVPLPDSIDDQFTTFGVRSRFGIDPTSARVGEIIANAGARVRRLHTHTGQMTPLHLVYKTRYLLTVAKHFSDVDSIDLGGGFFSLYTDPAKASAAWTQVGEIVNQFCEETGREISVIAEPGGALLAAHGYLVTTVISNESAHPGFGVSLVEVDASAWNIAPWHRPHAVPIVSDERVGELIPTLIAGNTLYENDYFGSDTRGKRRTFKLPLMKINDRIVFTASGAYTMSNSRTFNRIPLPEQYF